MLFTREMVVSALYISMSILPVCAADDNEIDDVDSSGNVSGFASSSSADRVDTSVSSSSSSREPSPASSEEEKVPIADSLQDEVRLRDAIKAGNCELVESILEKAPELITAHVGKYKRTPLDLAVRMGQI